MEATKMEELGRVRDRSKKADDKNPVIGNGYYWLNAVMVNDEEILPVYAVGIRRVYCFCPDTGTYR